MKKLITLLILLISIGVQGQSMKGFKLGEKSWNGDYRGKIELGGLKGEIDVKTKNSLVWQLSFSFVSNVDRTLQYIRDFQTNYGIVFQKLPESGNAIARKGCTKDGVRYYIAIYPHTEKEFITVSVIEDIKASIKAVKSKF